MTLTDARQQAEKNIAYLEQQREANEREEVILENKVKQAQLRTAFVMGQLTAAKQALNQICGIQIPQPVDELAKQEVAPPTADPIHAADVAINGAGARRATARR